MIKRFKKIAVITSLLMMLSTLSVFGASITSLDAFQLELIKNLTARQTSFVLTYTGDIPEFANQFKTVINQAYTTDDYLHSSILSYHAGVTSVTGIVNITVNATYVDTAEQEAYVTTQVPIILNQIIKTNMTDGQMVQAVYNWLITHVTYDYTLKKHSAYDALMGNSVCQGYALLMDKMLVELGVPTHIVIGTLVGKGHAWNECQIGGTWYFFDATNGVNSKDNYFGQSATALTSKSFVWTTTDYPVANSAYPYDAIPTVASGGTHIVITDLIMATNLNNAITQGWKQSGAKWNFLKSSDGTKKIGWLQVNNKWYYLDSDGYMVTGWNFVGGKWYYLNSSGNMATGWKLLGATWYYLNLNGDMATDTTVGGYYLGSTGAMLKR